MVTKGKVQVGPLWRRKGCVVNLFLKARLRKNNVRSVLMHGRAELTWLRESVFRRHGADGSSHLKEVALIPPGERAGVELSALVLAFLLDHSEDGGAPMQCTTRDTGTLRRRGFLAARIRLAWTDAGGKTSKLVSSKINSTRPKDS